MAEPTTTTTTAAVEKYLDFSTVDAVVGDGVVNGAYPGAVYVVGHNGRVAHLGTAGRYMYCPESPAVVPDTMWDMASCSKVVGCTTAAMILYDEGKLKLDQRVVEVLPEFGANGKETITVRNLLLHDSGLVPDLSNVPQYTTAEGFMAGVYASKLRNPVGAKMVYSDLSMITLGKMIEKITGEGLDVFLARRVFGPLGMRSSMYAPPAEVRPFCAPTEDVAPWREKLRAMRGEVFKPVPGCHPDAHLYIQGEVHDPSACVLNGVSGNAGLFSTGPDLCTFAQMMLDLGRFQNRQIVKAETVKLWTRRQSERSSRALGWDTPHGPFSGFASRFSAESYGHTGYTGPSIWIDPVANCYAIFLNNRVHPTSDNGKLVRTYRPRFHHAVADVLGLAAGAAGAARAARAATQP